MAKQEDPELTLFNGHTKITTTCRGAISERDPKKADKIFYN